MSQSAYPFSHFAHPSFDGDIGFASGEHTPPDGTYNRQWGAAPTDTSQGVHRPLEIRAVAFRDTGSKEEPLVLASIDLCILRDPEFSIFHKRVCEVVGLKDPARLVLQCTHTHGSVPFTLSPIDKPGSNLLVQWCQEMIGATASVARQAVEALEPATLSWETGCCSLATNRDLPLTDDRTGPYAVGYKPTSTADQTLVVGRVVAQSSGKTAGVIVHYACHPTTLAWENTLISPDYIGSAREMVEGSTGGQMVFLQGASGELSPRRQYTGDPAVADQNGRILGHAIEATLESMLPAGNDFTLKGVVTSGADLAEWRESPHQPRGGIRCLATTVDLPLLPRPDLDELRAQLATCTDRPIQERLTRQILRETNIGEGIDYANPVTFWQIGDIILIAQAQEAYSVYQTQLRAAFPNKTLLPLNVANGPNISYLYPGKMAGYSLYQVSTSPFAPEALSCLIEHCRKTIHSWDAHFE